MDPLYIYGGILLLVVVLFFLLKVIKNAIILSILTIIAALLINKFIYPIPTTWSDILLYIIVVLSLYLSLQILNLLFNICDIFYSLLKLLFSILYFPIKLLKKIFRSEEDNKKERKK